MSTGSEPCYIQSPGIFKNLAYSEPKAYSETCQTSMMKSSEEIVNHYNYSRNTSFSRSLFYEINIMNFFNTGRIFNPEVLILSKKVWGPKRPAAVNFNIPERILWDILSDKHKIFRAFLISKLHLVQ